MLETIVNIYIFSLSQGFKLAAEMTVGELPGTSPAPEGTGASGWIQGSSQGVKG